MPKTFQQHYAESGQQSYLDELMRTGKYIQEKAKYESGQGQFAQPIQSAGAFSSPALTPRAGTPPSPTASFSGGGDLDKFLRESGRQSELDQIRAIPGGYERANVEFQAGRGQYAGAKTGTTGTGTGVPQAMGQPAIDLPNLYENLYKESGISGLEDKLSKMEKDYITAGGNIDDNPFLSEATRVGRQAKLNKLFDQRTANIRGEIATKKADVETRLNLEMKQFDIQSEQARLAWDQFNVLLSSGALNNASGEDIANITRSTGISSSMLYSAIKANQKAPELNTQIIQTDDGTNIRATVINKDTGEIISSQVISASKPRAPKAVSQTEQKQAIISDLAQEAGQGATWDSLYRLSVGIIDPEEVYRIYLGYGIYNPTEEQKAEDLRRYGISSKGYTKEEGL